MLNFGNAKLPTKRMIKKEVNVTFFYKSSHIESSKEKFLFWNSFNVVRHQSESK